MKQAEIGDNKKCQTSFFAAAQMATVYSKSKRLVNIPVSLECPRRELKIDADATTVRGGKIIDDLVKSKIANEILDCWSKTGAGNLDPFKAGGIASSTSDRFCLLCAEIDFTPKFKQLAEEQSYKFEGMAYWAVKNRVPGQKYSLFEFLSGSQTDDVQAINKIKEGEAQLKMAMNMDKTYAVLWRADVYKPSAMASAWKSAKGALVAMAVYATGPVGMTIALASGYMSLGTLALGGLGGIGVTASAIYGFGVGLLNPGKGGTTKVEIHVAQLNNLADTKPPGSEYKYCSVMLN
ncbi:TPA: hypothetical protein HA265_06820 [Candidatus Woesearchaeota archaeon]|nr:hypothetical protein [Candidatus Woesearchaeota archaeon]